MKQLFDEVKTVTRSRQIVDQFRRAIGEGTIKIGDKLPPERDLCQQLGVSRTSLREAMRILEAYGVLDFTQGGGTYVTDKFAENIFEFLGFGGRMNKEMMIHLLDTRKLLETGALEQVMVVVKKSGLAKLRSIVKELEKESDIEKLGQHDAEFHETIIDLSGNPILSAIYRMIYKMTFQAVSRVATYPTARDIVIKDHSMILTALENRDKDAGIRLLNEHFEHTRKIIDQYFQ